MTSPRTAGVFPGQGSQSVGMGRELVEQYSLARDTFAEADGVLGFGLTAVCFDGPAEELKRTSIAQPALLTISTAYWRVISARGFTCEGGGGAQPGRILRAGRHRRAGLPRCTAPGAPPR